MKKCGILSVVLVTLITASTPEDICKSCVHISKCPLFTSMGLAEQQSWLRKYPCNNHHADDYGKPAGSIAQGNFICCPNQFLGEDKGQSSRITEENRIENPRDKPSSSVDQRQYSSFFNDYTQNKDGVGTNDGYVMFANKQWVSNSETNQNRPSPSTKNPEPSRWNSMSRNKYWNERPDRNNWDIGNQNFYHGNNNDRFSNNRRNYYNNNQRAGRNNYDQGRNQPDFSSNNRGSQRNDNSQYNPYYPGNRESGNSPGKSGQCDRLTSFPPDSRGGCCGREASDDDRITDAPIYNNYNAPTNNNRGWDYEEEPPNYDWSYSMFKEEESTSVTLNNKTETVVNGNQGASGTVSVENRISGGKETELTQYPWTALLITTFENGVQQTMTAFSCGGSLISSKYVLTAGHCVYDAEAVMKGVEVFLAEYDKRTFPQDCKITAEGRKCIENIALRSLDVTIHPRFDEARLQNDIALIKLQTNAPYTDYIRPICLPSINIDNPEHARLPLTVAGWGRNGQYKSDIKQSTTVHLVPQHDCKKFYPDLTRRHLCAAGYTGEDTCKGDSGGPLMVRYRGTYYVVGVVSGKRTDSPCGSAVPSLYTNVYHYLDWIRSTITE